MTDAPQQPADQAASHIWFLRQVPLFEEQTESMYNSADRRSKIQNFKRGDIIPVSNKSRKYIYLVLDGQVKLCSTTESGKEIITDIVGSGDVFGALDLVLAPSISARPGGQDDTPLEAVALSKGTALRFDLSYFHELVQRRPKIVFNVSRILGLKQKQLEIRLKRILYRTSLGKVAGLLMELSDKYGEKEGDTIRIGVRVTHQEMASVIGSKRETVSEALAELEYRELISTQGGGMVILKPEELDKIP